MVASASASAAAAPAALPAPRFRLLEPLALLAISLPALALFARIEDASIRASLAAAAGFAAVACAATLWLVPMFSWYLERRGLKGKDMGRRGTALEDKEMCAAARLRALVSARAPA